MAEIKRYTTEHYFTGNMSGLVAAIGSSPAELVFQTSEPANGNITFPDTLALAFRADGKIRTVGYDLTIEAAITCDIDKQCLDLASGGSVSGLKGTLYPHWFGATGDGTTDDTVFVNRMIASASADTLCVLPNGFTFKVNPSTLSTDSANVRWLSEGGKIKATINGRMNFGNFDENGYDVFDVLVGDEPFIIEPVTEIDDCGFFELGKNLFDKSTAIANYYVFYTNGWLLSNASYHASAFIPVEADTTYTRSHEHQMAFYDSDKVYISGIAAGADPEFTTPATAAYVKLTIPNANIDEYQLELGPYTTDYEAYAPTIKPENNHLSGHFELSENLFNKKDTILDYYVVYSTGALASDTSYHASDYIPVESDTIYVRSHEHEMAFYDSDKVYISGIDAGADPEFTTPATAAYVRLTIPNEYMEVYQFELGSYSTDYEEYGDILAKRRNHLTLYFELGKNLFNKNTSTPDYYVRYTTGGLLANVLYHASAFIPVIADTTYTRSYEHEMAFYDSDKVYISGIDAGADLTFTTPVNAFYVRLTVANASVDEFQLERGPQSTDYEVYGEILKEKHNHLSNYFESGKNLFDKDFATPDYYVLYTNGVLTSNASYHASDYISVESDTIYVRSHEHQMAFYDSDKVYISGIDAGADPEFTTPSTAAYVRLTIPNANVDEYQFESGSHSTDYEEYGEILKERRNHLSDYFEFGKNLFDKNASIPDYYILYTNGALTSNVAYHASDYIPVESDTTYTRSYEHQMAFYDIDKVYISGIVNGSDPTFITPANTVYVRVTIANASVDEFQLEVGPYSTKFSEYIEVLKGKHLTEEAKVEFILPSKIWGLEGILASQEEINIYFTNIMLGDTSRIVDIISDYGKHYEKFWRLLTDDSDYDLPTAAFDLAFTALNTDLETLAGLKVEFEIVDKTDTTQVYHLAIGDSLTRDGSYVEHMQNKLTNVDSVGTRTYDSGTLNREGRGGWSLNTYLTGFDSSSVDSPFLFPIGVAAGKYKGSINDWKNICYDDPTGYDYEGFQYIAQGWTAGPYLYNTGGFLISPSVGDVMYNNPAAAGDEWVEWAGASWDIMSPQPSGVEFSFSKYMQRFSDAFTGQLPTHASLLLGANDFQTSNGISDSAKTTFLAGVRTIQESIQTYDASIKFIVCLPTTGAEQDAWGKSLDCGGTSYNFDRNMKTLSKALIEEFDNSTDLALGIHIAPLGAFLDPDTGFDRTTEDKNIYSSETIDRQTNWVHPNATVGHKQMGDALAAVVQANR